MQEIHYVMRNIQLIDKNSKVIADVIQYLNTLPEIHSEFTFIGHTTDKVPVLIVFNTSVNAFTTAYHLLGELIP